MKVVAVIPARFASTRLPGKPLQNILGQPMIQWVWEGVKQSKLVSGVILATDDDRIENVARAFGADVTRTRPECRNGTERCAEAVKTISCDWVLNVQGDEPLIAGAAVDGLCEALEKTPCEMATMASPLRDEAELQNPNVVKVLCNKDMHAIYFSRAPIGRRLPGAGALHIGPLKHAGIYAYRAEFLQRYVLLPPCPLEEMESLEQLRALYYGARVLVVPTAHTFHGVDTAEDLRRVEQILQHRTP